MKNDVLDVLFKSKFFDPYRAYREIDNQISKNQAAALNEAICERLKTETPPTVNNVLLTGAVLFKTGSKEKKLIEYFLTHVTTRINIDQYLFLIYAIYDNQPPVSSEIMFDFINYTYLDNEVIQKKLDELTASLNRNLTKRIVLFLLLLSLRQDVANENYRIIVLVLNNVAPDVITLARKLSAFKEYGDIVDEAMRFNIKMSDVAEKEIRKKPAAQKKTVKKTADATVVKEDEKVKKKTAAKKEVEPAQKTQQKSKTPSEKQAIAALVLEPVENKTDAKPAVKSEVPEDGFSLSDVFKNKRILFISSSAVVIALILVFTLTGRNKHPRENTPVRASSVSETVVEQIVATDTETIAEQQEIAEQPEAEEKTISSEEVPAGSYVVQKGDTLSHISKRYLNDASRYYEIASENRIENPDLIYPGQHIVVKTQQ